MHIFEIMFPVFNIRILPSVLWDSCIAFSSCLFNIKLGLKKLSMYEFLKASLNRVMGFLSFSLADHLYKNICPTLRFHHENADEKPRVGYDVQPHRSH